MGCCTFASHNCAVHVMGVMGWDPMMDEVFTDLPWMCSFGAIIIGKLTVFAQVINTCSIQASEFS